ncbi:MAG: zf-HC2 domain-containing protein [Planctomycetes bacterium]|nr:zf-HC2 domain-containing protein [Planctomycetota bacterium]
MRKFSCDEARAHLSDALSGEIGRPEANVLEAHLLECDPCKSLTELFLWQDRVIAELAGQARLDALMARVRTGLENLDQVTVADEERLQRAWLISRRWVAAAAVFVLALIGVLFWKPAAPPNSTAQLTPAPRNETQTAPAPEPVDTAVKAPDEHPVVTPIENPVPPAPVVAEAPKNPTPPVSGPAKPEVVVRKDVDPTPVRAPDPSPEKKTPGKEVVQKPRTLDDAVRGGMVFLKEKAAKFGRDSKSDELLLWTYLQGGMAEADPEFQALLKPALEKQLERTYNVALTAMVLEELDRVKYQKRIAQCAQFLLDNQCGNGQWDYGKPSIFVEEVNVPPLPPKSKGPRKVIVTRKREGPATGDNSNSMYAMLGLRACHDAGIVLPRASIDQAAKGWRDSQSRSVAGKVPALSASEGWCYSRHDHKPYGSMTAGGVGSLVICDYILNADWRKDPHVLAGMEWLAKNFSVTYNPGPYEHASMEENSLHQHHYYLYALERAAILYGTEQIGGNYWFAKGVSALVDSQRPDGSWKSGSGDVVMDTCFAVLFLRKATRALVETPTQGAGTVPKK